MNHHRIIKLSRLLRSFAAAGISLGCAWADPVTETTAVQKAPDPAAPIITYLKAGSEAVPAADASVSAPPGWMAVTVAGPFEGYVLNRDLTKSLDVKAGSSIYLAPSLDAGVLTVAAKGDKSDITGLHGKWTQVRLNKSVVGYIRLGPSPAAIQPAAAAPLTETSPPIAQAAGTTAAIGRDVTALESNDPSALPKSIEGRFVSSHTLIPFRHPYAWQLVDDAGHRSAYIDISRLLLTDQIERYVNHEVQVFGIVKPLPNREDIVIAAESLQLK